MGRLLAALALKSRSDGRPGKPDVHGCRSSRASPVAPERLSKPIRIDNRWPGRRLNERNHHVRPDRRATTTQFTGSQIAVLATLAIIGFFLLVAVVLLAKYFNLWIQAMFSEAKVTLRDLVGMSLRKVNPNIIVRSKIMAIQAGLSEKDGVTTRSLEAHYLAGGNVPNVVRALIAANRADIPLSYKRAAAIDLAGRNVLDAKVQTSVNPKVIELPGPDQGPARRSTGSPRTGFSSRSRLESPSRTNIDRARRRCDRGDDHRRVGRRRGS